MAANRTVTTPRPPVAAAPAEVSPSSVRRRDSERSRAKLLAAAAALFAERGYAGTGLRAVGERAGVDAALVARYFGGKEGLYRAVLAADPLGEPGGSEAPTSERSPSEPAGSGAGSAPAAAAVDLVSDDPAALVRRLFLRWETTGVTAVSQNVFRCDTDAATRQATAQRLEESLLPSLRAMSGDPDPDLRAELAAAVVLSVGVARSAGVLSKLAETEADELADLVEQLVRTALG